MYDICAGCGASHQEKEIDPSSSSLICPSCGFKQRFQYLPLFVITGASGTGKSTMVKTLLERDDRPDVVYLDSDMLLMKEFEGDGYRDIWLWVCLNIAQSGRPVALFGSAGPEEFERASRRPYFSAIHYLALTCRPDMLEQRLKARPAWRQASSPEFIEAHVNWNKWFIDNAARTEPVWEIIDTTDKTHDESAEELIGWIRNAIN